MSNFDFDLVVLGGGPGGYVAAIAASHKGLKVALVEADLIGGTCLNRGCIPTKALLASAHAYHDMKRAHEFGLECEKVSFSFEKIMKRKDDIVAKLRDGINQLIKSNKITLVNGFGKINDEHSLTINNEKKITFNKLIIATGSKPVNLPFMPEG
ncbi:MAG TPA: FAD-dependent oxidoreductase, partial [Candidatus Wallbacteria bacterium]|nr:FAD-dependent oxidoreductase [Candidatus Wallbacteria bacterium]